MTICDRTGLTKPECHCPTCMAAMIAEHAPAPRADAARRLARRRRIVVRRRARGGLASPP